MIAFSPVRQHPRVLELFLKHMAKQPVELWAYDDNDNDESSEILFDAAMAGKLTLLPTIPNLEPSYYLRREDTHLWNVATYHRVAKIKNAAIDRYLKTDAPALFLIDSDVLLRPGTIAHLDSAQLPILASVYWTKWSPHHGRGPNMWGGPPEPLTKAGHHEVKGLGACTLLRREVLLQARFDPIPHLKNEGEDRWFCYLATQAGYKLVMCSHLEPFHVYRDSEIPAASRWSRKWLG